MNLVIAGSTGIAAATASLALSKGHRVFTIGLDESANFRGDLRDERTADASLSVAWDALGGIEFHHASLALHTDPIYAPANPLLWSFLNCRPHGAGFCESSMWLAGVVTGCPPATAAKLWKSWTTHRLQQPAQVLHQADFMHMLPTPASIRAQIYTRLLQGRTGLWFAGGYLFPYDAQETALLSAIEVANGLNGGSTPRGDALLASV